MTVSTPPDPETGLPVGQPAVPPGLRISVFIDYIKLVLRFPKLVQTSSVNKFLPKEWGAFMKVNIAAHLPNAKSNESKNACDCHTFTIHEPHKQRFNVDQLWAFLAAAGATLDTGMSTVEWGLDIYPTKEVPLTREKLGQLAEDVVRCFNIRGVGLKLTPSLGTSRKKGRKKQTNNMAEDLGRGWTVYIGEQPDWKIDADQHRWLDCLGFKCYYKVTDQGEPLPESEHRVRLEFTASATSCPVDAIELLMNDRAAKKRLATYFWLDLKTSGLLYVIQHALRACWASIPLELLEAGKKQRKSPAEIFYKAVNGPKCEVVYSQDDVMRPFGRKQGITDSNWNDRISKAFERLRVG